VSRRAEAIAITEQLQLLESKAYKTGIIRLNYKPIKQ